MGNGGISNTSEVRESRPDTPSWIKVTSGFFVGTVLFQFAIILACAVLDIANSNAGFMQYRLPQTLFFIYVWVGIGAPGIALTTLAVLYSKRSSLWSATGNISQAKLRRLVVLSVINVFALFAWFYFGGLVFFGAGGTR